jgi:TPR repeat protein
MVLVLKAAMESLEVNPSINGFMVGEMLYRSEIWAELGLSELENKELAFKWFTFSASYGNEKALFKLSKMYLNELVLELIDNGTILDNESVLKLNRSNLYFDDDTPLYLVDKIKNFFSQKPKYTMSEESTVNFLQNAQNEIPSLTRCNPFLI